MTATYATANTSPPCNSDQYVATVTVWNDGNGYSASCTGCATFPFVALLLCDPTECASGTDYEYTIALDLNIEDGGGLHLHTVNYSAISIDDGETIDSNCDTIRSVSPTSQSWSANDTTFPCSFDCDTDTTITITYE